MISQVNSAFVFLAAVRLYCLGEEYAVCGREPQMVPGASDSHPHQQEQPQRAGQYVRIDTIISCYHVHSRSVVESTICCISSRPLGSAEADDVLQKCQHVLEVLDQHDEELFSEWTEGLQEICETHLKDPLLTLDADTGLFQVNFSTAVSTTF